jgi:REP element-mobilizing transposase RayT/CheY-like chemotaxis protein
MSPSLLVVTPDPGFGEIIEQTIKKAGSYQVRVVSDQESALLYVEEAEVFLALLDLDFSEDTVVEMGRALRAFNPNMGLVVLTDDDQPPSLDGIRPWTQLRKRLHLADMLALLGEELPVSEEFSGDPEIPPEPPDESMDGSWLGDVSKAAQYLTRLTLESSAQAALMTKQGELWAYAGQLSQGAAKELAEIVGGQWDEQGSSNLLRFVRLEATKAEHVLYATQAADDFILALVFDAETPFGTIRSQANRLIQSMSATESADISEIPIPESSPRPEIRNSQLEITPDSDGSQDGIQRGSSSGKTRAAPSRRSGREASPVISFKDLIRPRQPVDLETEVPEQGANLLEELEATMPARPTTSVYVPEGDQVDETRPHPLSEVPGRIILEPVSPALYNLSYACLLVPRLNTHYLTGDLAAHISDWLPQICVIFGWRLEYMSIRPEYLQWVVNVPPATSPAHLMRVIRRQTSEKIFEEFGRIKKENPSGDFWAPGYLILGGTQPHPPQLVNDYINQTRQRQGIYRSRG